MRDVIAFIFSLIFLFFTYRKHTGFETRLNFIFVQSTESKQRAEQGNRQTDREGIALSEMKTTEEANRHTINDF